MRYSNRTKQVVKDPPAMTYSHKVEYLFVVIPVAERKVYNRVKGGTVAPFGSAAVSTHVSQKHPHVFSYYS